MCKLKTTVKKLSVALDKLQRRRRLNSVKKELERHEAQVCKLQRRLGNLREVQADTRHRDSQTEASQRMVTIQSVELKLHRVMMGAQSIKAEVAAALQVVQCRRPYGGGGGGGGSKGRRTLEEGTLLNMLRYLIDRCNNELKCDDDDDEGRDDGRVGKRAMHLWKIGVSLINEIDSNGGSAQNKRVAFVSTNDSVTYKSQRQCLPAKCPCA